MKHASRNLLLGVIRGWRINNSTVSECSFLHAKWSPVRALADGGVKSTRVSFKSIDTGINESGFSCPSRVSVNINS